jgi:Flp pilus assembly protein CpaB
VGPVPTAARRRSPLRRRIPRSRTPLHRRVRQDPAGVRRWLLVAGLAWAAAALVDRSLDQAHDAQDRWGRTTAVWVVERPLGTGDRLAGALRQETWPQALAPGAAIARVPADARAAGRLDPGTPITAAALEQRTAARRTVAVPVPAGGLPVGDGDRVDVWATADPTTVADGDDATRRVATDARVARSTDRAVVLEVRPAQVEALAAAAASATITLVGVP